MHKQSKNQNAREKQSKFIMERIASVEKYFSEICCSMRAYTRKAARVRDKGDELSKVLQTYAMSEKVNKSLSQGLLNFSRALSLISDHRDAEVIRLDTKVIQELAQYDTICRHAKDELKQSINIRDKEASKKRNLDKIREKSPANRQQISLAENELTKTTVEVVRTIRNLEKQTETFEKEKLRDMKSIMLDFIQVEMAMHAKAIEILTASYQDICNINEQDDFQDFQKMRRALDRDFYKSMKIQMNEFGNNQKCAQNTKIHERARTHSMSDLFVASASKNIDTKEDEILHRGLSMDSVNSDRYVKIKPSAEGIPESYFNYEFETDEESLPQIVTKNR